VPDPGFETERAPTLDGEGVGPARVRKPAAVVVAPARTVRCARPDPGALGLTLNPRPDPGALFVCSPLRAARARSAISLTELFALSAAAS